MLGFYVNNNVPDCLLVTPGEAPQGSIWGRRRKVEEVCEENIGHQCLFCCLVHRVIVTIFLNSIYMR